MYLIVVFLCATFSTFQFSIAADVASNVATRTCDECGTEQVKLSRCNRCKEAKYCDATCQKAAWSRHKAFCKPKIVTPAAPLTPPVARRQIDDFWLGTIDAIAQPELFQLYQVYQQGRVQIPSETTVDDTIVRPIVDNYLVARGSELKILIVGCGKAPYAWTPIMNTENNTWKNMGPTGDHTHADALTLAEDARVLPQILMDFLKDLPDSMREKFDEVYFEMLPPDILGNKKIYENAYAALKPGGLLVLDLRVRRLQAQVSTVYFMSPFELVKPANTSDEGDNRRENLLESSLSKLGFTEIHIATVPENIYNGRLNENQIFARKPRP